MMKLLYNKEEQYMTKKDMVAVIKAYEAYDSVQFAAA